MRNLLIGVGAIVLLLVLAGSGTLHGDLCFGSVGCVGANDSGIRIHGAKP